MGIWKNERKRVIKDGLECKGMGKEKIDKKEWSTDAFYRLKTVSKLSFIHSFDIISSLYSR